MTPGRWSAAVGTLVVAMVLMPRAFDALHPLGDGPLWGRALQVGIGLSFVWGGLAAMALRAERRTGRLMVACGLTYWLGLLIDLRVPIVWSLSSAFQFVAIVLIAYLVLAFPDGDLGSWWKRFVVGVFIFCAALDAAFSVFYDPAAFGCTNCQEGLNIFLIRNDFDLISLKGQIAGTAAQVALLLLAVSMIVRFVRATPPARRVLGPMLVPALGWALAYESYLTFQFFANHSIYEAPETLYTIFLSLLFVFMLVLPIAFVIGLMRLRARRGRLGQLVLQLGELPTPEHLQEALRRALGDPSLEVGIWVEDAKRYLSATGTTMKLPPQDERVTTNLERHGEPLGVIVHDPALLDDPGLIAAVGAATRLAVENERLQEEVMNQLAEVHASRARLVEAADAERRRIERNLHDGAQQRLVSLSLALRLVESKIGEFDPDARQSLADATQELEEALTELRDLARGMYPAVLTDHGLEAALESLAARSKMPLEVQVADSDRLDTRIETTAFFIASEAVANATKHSGASSIQIRTSLDNGWLNVEIEDDGVGGASVAAGSGLRGLVDRVDALGGRMTIESPLGQGTRITARLPCE